MTADCIAAQEATTTKTNRVAQVCAVLLLLVLALGIFVRVWKLGSWPPLFGDEAAPGVLALRGLAAVSYTHLDVYKRQELPCVLVPRQNSTTRLFAMLKLH